MNPTPNTRPVAFLTLYSGYTFIKVPKHDLIIAITCNMNKIREQLDKYGKLVLLGDGSMRPVLNYETDMKIQYFTNEEYLAQMELIDTKGMK